MSNLEPIEASSKQKPQKRNYSDHSISIMIEPGVSRANSLRELTLKFFARSSMRTERGIFVKSIGSIIERGIFVKILWLDLCFQRLIICGADMTTALLPLGSLGCSRYRINIERQLKVNSAHLKN